MKTPALIYLAVKALEVGGRPVRAAEPSTHVDPVSTKMNFVFMYEKQSFVLNFFRDFLGEKDPTQEIKFEKVGQNKLEIFGLRHRLGAILELY